MSSFPGSAGCSARSMPTASHYWHTPDAGGKVDKDNPTQVGRALQRLGIELIAAYSPEARGRSERMFGTLQKRLPQELRLAGITGPRPTASSRRSICPNTTPASPPRPRTSLRPLRRRARRHPVHPRGPHRRAAPCATSAWHQIPADRHRRRVSRRHARRLPRTPMPGPLQGRRRAHRHLNPAGRVIRFDATGQSPVDKWTAAPRLTTSPQAQQPQPKRSTHLVHKPVRTRQSSAGCPQRKGHRSRRKTAAKRAHAFDRYLRPPAVSRSTMYWALDQGRTPAACAGDAVRCRRRVEWRMGNQTA